MILRPFLAALALGAALTACSDNGGGIDFHDNPGPGVAKDKGPLTLPPANLERGAPQSAN